MPDTDTLDGQSTGNELDQQVIAFLTDYRRYLGAIIRRHAPDEQVEDLVQQASLLIWQHRKQWDGRAHLHTWAVTVAVNVARDWWRKQHAEMRDGETVTINEQLVEGEPRLQQQPELVYERRQLLDAVRVWALELTPSLRRAIEKRLAGESAQKIALHRAVKALQAKAKSA